MEGQYILPGFQHPMGIINDEFPCRECCTAPTFASRECIPIRGHICVIRSKRLAVSIGHETCVPLQLQSCTKHLVRGTNAKRHPYITEGLAFVSCSSYVSPDPIEKSFRHMLDRKNGCHSGQENHRETRFRQPVHDQESYRPKENDGCEAAWQP